MNRDNTDETETGDGGHPEWCGRYAEHGTGGPWRRRQGQGTRMRMSQKLVYGTRSTDKYTDAHARNVRDEC